MIRLHEGGDHVVNAQLATFEAFLEAGIPVINDLKKSPRYYAQPDAVPV